MKRFLPLVLVLFSIFNAIAQNSQNKLNLTEGTRYTVAFPQVWASPSEKPLPQPMLLLVSSKVKTKVRVTTPALINEAPRIDREFTIEPNKVLRIPISVSYMNTQSETKTGFGIVVTSKNAISVSTFQQWNGNGEMARHIPVGGWGKNYYTMNFYQDRYGSPNEGYNYRPSQILLIADKDNTVVTYTPTFDTEGGMETSPVRKGQSQTITLEKGECFLIKAKIDEIKNKEWETDLSGTLIRSTKPIGVVSGHTKVGILRYPDILVGLGGSSPAHFVRNNVHDAMLPIEMAGTKFFTVPCRYTATRITGKASEEFGVEDDRGDVIRVIALEDNTTVKTMRQDGSSFKNEWVLRKGETRIMPSLEVPTYWESDKPILMGQYGKSYAKDRGVAVRGSAKGEESALGHPSVESGMPMLQYIPSVDRYVNYGVFTSPEGLDNFMNIVFKADEISKIKFDNKPLNSAFGGAMRYFKGTPYASLAVPVGAGDHYIESTEPNVRWAAWSYGSMDGLTQGRAYGTPISIDLSIPCDDSLQIEHQIVCGDVEGKVKLLPDASACAQFFSFVVENEMNFILDAEVDLLQESKVFPFALKIVDKRKPAYAKIRVVTRSGNWIEKEFRYDGIGLEFEPKEINFGTQPFNQEICTTVVVRNIQSSPITLDELKFGNKEFNITPNSLQLAPNESKEVKICGNVIKPGTLRDSIVAKINCVDIKYLPVEIRGDEPVFYADDQNWGNLPKNSKVTREVELFNAGKVEVVITEYQPRGDSHFTNSTLINSLPLRLNPGQRFTYNVDYSPNGEINVPHELRINYIINAKKQKLYSDLSGKGSDAELTASPISWLERVIDKYQVSKGINSYTRKVRFEYSGNTVGRINSISIESTDNVFTWKGDGTLTDQMSPGDFREIDLNFTPTELPGRAAEKKYKGEIVVKYSVWGEEKETRGSIEGTALQPQVQITNQNWNTQPINSITTLPIEIWNSNPFAFAPLTKNEGGTMDLIVDSLVIEGNAPFVWTKTGTKVITFNPPLRVGSLLSQQISVDFVPKMYGVYKTKYRLYGNVLDTNFATLEGKTVGQSEVYPLNLITWIGTTTSGTIQGKIEYSTSLLFKEFRGGDYVLFSPASSSPLTPFSVGPNTPFEYRIEFKPDKVTKKGLKSGQNLNNRLPYQDQSFATQIVFEDASGNELVGDVTGDGKYLETTLRIVSPKNVNIGQSNNVSFILQPVPESIDSGNVESARLRVFFDGEVIVPTRKKLFPTAMTVDELTFIDMIEVDLTTPPQVDGFLGSYDFGALLSSKSFTTVEGLYYTIDKGGKQGSTYVVVNVIPDEFTVVPVCANIRRVVDLTNPSTMVVKNNMVEVTVGIDAPLTLASVNELGQQKIIFSGFVKKGTYHFSIQTPGLQWISASQGLWNEVMGVFIH